MQIKNKHNSTVIFTEEGKNEHAEVYMCRVKWDCLTCHCMHQKLTSSERQESSPKTICAWRDWASVLLFPKLDFLLSEKSWKKHGKSVGGGGFQDHGM